MRNVSKNVAVVSANELQKWDTHHTIEKSRQQAGCDVFQESDRI